MRMDGIADFGYCNVEIDSENALTNGAINP